MQMSPVPHRTAPHRFQCLQHQSSPSQTVGLFQLIKTPQLVSAISMQHTDTEYPFTTLSVWKFTSSISCGLPWSNFRVQLNYGGSFITNVRGDWQDKGQYPSALVSHRYFMLETVVFWLTQSLLSPRLWRDACSHLVSAPRRAAPRGFSWYAATVLTDFSSEIEVVLNILVNISFSSLTLWIGFFFSRKPEVSKLWI